MDKTIATEKPVDLAKKQLNKMAKLINSLIKGFGSLLAKSF
jgi:hypothetical protein